ncbi:hypothetical protein RND71_002908 [Anisodus tanguticus]|uniref:Uncharacterized protein n=1 Tax=Anisodus tanguticus TaxID=243964 RepID=A0AAE1VPI0_9SOLA|nr:hypothetical protein RND71_002908 [Anisodus tanguticus]
MCREINQCVSERSHALHEIPRNLRWNKLQDVIPLEIGELKQLTHLYLSFNNFKGEIPKELANLPELRYLHLHEIHFTGRIPSELGTLQYLRHVDVGNNRLVGTIRELIRVDFHGCFPALRNLYLNSNYLTGGIQAQLANLTNLEIFYEYHYAYAFNFESNLISLVTTDAYPTIRWLGLYRLALLISPS